MRHKPEEYVSAAEEMFNNAPDIEVIDAVFEAREINGETGAYVLARLWVSDRVLGPVGDED